MEYRYICLHGLLYVRCLLLRPFLDDSSSYETLLVVLASSRHFLAENPLPQKLSCYIWPDSVLPMFYI